MTIEWRKSSRSGGVNDQACVELATLPRGVGIRDSKNPAAGHLHLDRPGFARLVHEIKRGALDR